MLPSCRLYPGVEGKSLRAFSVAQIKVQFTTAPIDSPTLILSLSPDCSGFPACKGGRGRFWGVLSFVAMSKRWSCGTLKDGFDDVMEDTLWEEQRRLEKEVKDPIYSFVKPVFIGLHH